LRLEPALSTKQAGALFETPPISHCEIVQNT